MKSVGKTLLGAAFLVVLAVMTWVTLVASNDRSVLSAAAEIWADPWGRATLCDTYFAFLTLYLWIYHREPTWGRRLLWLVLLLTLGNFAIATYFLIALGRLGPGTTWRALFEAPTLGESTPEENRA